MAGRKFGHEVSAETRAKISASLKGRKLGPSKLRGRKQSPELVAKRQRRMPESCTVEGCEKVYLAKGLCKTHYYRLRKTGTTDDPPGVLREIGYHGVHIRARRALPRRCSVCDGDGGISPLEVALRHDASPENLRIQNRDTGPQAYSVSEADYVRLCSLCHKKYDQTGPVGRQVIVALLTQPSRTLA